jgi:hypothetical protein
MDIGNGIVSAIGGFAVALAFYLMCPDGDGDWVATALSVVLLVAIGVTLMM